METAARQLNDKFALVQRPADNLSKGNIELPSFPDIVMRVRQALEDEHCTTDQLVQLIGAEPVLAARLLNVANLAAPRPSGDPITDLNMAVSPQLNLTAADMMNVITESEEQIVSLRRALGK